MPNIYDYVNYRDFLRDFYREKKTENPSFSYQQFARSAGFGSKSFLPHVIEGKKNLSDDSLFRLKTVVSQY